MTTTQKHIIATASTLGLFTLGSALATPKPGNPEVTVGEETSKNSTTTTLIERTKQIAEDTAQSVEDSVEAARDEAREIVRFEGDYKNENLADVIDEIDSLETLSDLIDDADLEETLNESGTYTVFAPTDAAFDQLSEEQLDMLRDEDNTEMLRQCLLGHVVQGKTMKADVSSGTLSTAGNSTLNVEINDKGVMIGNAKVIATDIETANGVIHLIDTVLTQKEAVSSN
ncbi:MAG: fasciclin domain-containing protein [Verrucomicrobiales bacterium]